MKIHKALFLVDVIQVQFGDKVEVIVEDARKRKWFGKDSDVKQQGAGSVKRDAVIWEDFLFDKNIRHQMIHPLKGGTKWSKEMFRAATGYEKQASKHARDACLLVWGR